jgi:hypothetical protein
MYRTTARGAASPLPLRARPWYDDLSRGSPPRRGGAAEGTLVMSRHHDHRSRPAVLALLAAGALAPAAASAGPPPVDLLSHRAAYRLSLAEDKGGGDGPSGGGIASANGVLALEWRADCSGWLSQQRMGFVAKPAEEGPDIVYDVRFSSWEAPDYSRLRFQVRNFEDGKPQAFSGAAALTRPSGGGEAHYTEPEGNRVELPAGTLFPTEHVLELIGAARRGERTVRHHVFDGSGPDALNEVTAVIGRPEAAPGEGGREERRWPVRLAYYDIGPADGLPEFEISFRLGEDGVLRDLVLDYGEFALKGELEKLEPLAEPACE